MKANINTLKGSLYLILAACCYGMLGTFVKLAYRDGYNTAEVTISQFFLGFLTLLIINVISRKSSSVERRTANGVRSYLKLIISGTSLGLTSIFYYMSVQYIPVSICIVLLVQAVWMSLVAEMIQKQKKPQFYEIITVVIIIFGTTIATDVWNHYNQINWKGAGWGILGALSYTATIYSSNNIELDLLPIKRSFLMVSGGFIIVLIVFGSSLLKGFSFGIFLSWGILISVFGTILPPILFTKGMPLTGMGLGAILTSLEIPVAVLFAHFLLDEQVAMKQWLGVCLILIAVIQKNAKML
ncbi:EamA family transporter [Flavobacterium johnsoniae]|uniref:Permease n=1 Tax=Flavobacterium johnsoniae TaxID=986 RepID=A0A1J7BNS0_FLAJO|nr:DMT family transporter [Flavobacterium johnsoniae]OIV40359.1 permease [Flavobacterium johnsoniae]